MESASTGDNFGVALLAWHPTVEEHEADIACAGRFRNAKAKCKRSSPSVALFARCEVGRPEARPRLEIPTRPPNRRAERRMPRYLAMPTRMRSATARIPPGP
jgi:hypothetical protein